MEPNNSFWQRLGLRDWFLTDESKNRTEQQRSLTPDNVYTYIIEKFNESVGQLSFADRVVFYHEYIVCFNPDDYQQFMNNKQGIFGLIVHESVKKFYELLKQFRAGGKSVQPSSSKWVFRFVSHPDYAPGDMGFIGKLLPGGTKQKEENLRVTFIPRHTGIAQTFDVNQNILNDFTFYSEGYYEIPYYEALELEGQVTEPEKGFIARLETILPEREFAGKKVEYLMKDLEIIVSGKDETRTNAHIFRVPSDWVSTPHLSVRFNRSDGKFYLASFGEKTLLNEKEIKRSDVNAPEWTEVPVNSRMLLNGIVGINIFKS